MKESSDSIISCLQGIKKVGLDECGCLEATIKLKCLPPNEDQDVIMGGSEWVRDSFMYGLFSLIEEHMTNDRFLSSNEFLTTENESIEPTIETPKRTPEEIVFILHSIKKVSIDIEDCIEVVQDNDLPCGITSFHYGSFTRDLLELIEEHLNANQATNHQAH